MLAEDRGRRVIVERARRSPCAARPRVTIHQSGCASPGTGRKLRCREMRRSEFVTVPDFSPHVAAGSSTCAQRVVSVSRTQSETTTSSQRSSARRTRSASGMLTTGFVDMIQMALIVAALDGVEQVDGLEARPCARCAAHSRSAATRSTWSRGEVHVRRELVREPADLAPAHRVRLARQRERPHAGLADAARREMHVDDRVDLVGAARRLIHALRERRHRRAACARTSDRTRARRPRRARTRAATAGIDAALSFAHAQRGAEALRVRVEELEIERILARASSSAAR